MPGEPFDLPLPLRTAEWSSRIARMDPERDCEEIARILVNHVFPFEFLVALELAQFRTFSIPSIGKILHATGQYEREGQKRLDDTRAILTEIHRPGLDTKESRETVLHLNRIHALYDISNDDFLYTLSTFVFDPPAFIERWGYRPFSEKEKDALHFLYRKLGALMRIRDVPETRARFLAWRNDYERRAQRYSPEGAAVARGMMTALAAPLPAVLRPAFEATTIALLDPSVRTSVGFRAPAGMARRSVSRFAAVYRAVTARLSFFERSEFGDTKFATVYPTYPNGYDRLRLGPTKVIAFLDRKRQV